MQKPVDIDPDIYVSACISASGGDETYTIRFSSQMKGSSLEFLESVKELRAVSNHILPITTTTYDVDESLDIRSSLLGSIDGLQ
jgi:hypothetical protein